MRLPRKGILIRILVYGGLLGFFGWRALKPHVTDQGDDSNDAKRLRELQQQSRTVTLPNGETQVIYEITPEQAERLFGVRPEAPAPDKSDGSQKAPAAVEHTSSRELPVPAKDTGSGDTDATSSESGDDASTASR